MFLWKGYIKQVDTYIYMHQEMDHKMATPLSFFYKGGFPSKSTILTIQLQSKQKYQLGYLCHT